MKLRHMLGLALVLPVLGACSSTPEPEPVFASPAAAVAPDPVSSIDAIAGTYTLVGYGTIPIPFTVDRDDVKDCTSDVMQGSLMLRADGTWDYSYTERETCKHEIETRTESVGGTYTLRDGRLHFNETRGDDGPEGQGTMEARDFEVGWLQNGELRIQPEGIEGIWLRFRR